MVDTNVLVSGLKGEDAGACRAIIRAVIQERLKAVISGPLFHEYRDVILGRDDLFRGCVLEHDREMILATFVAKCAYVESKFRWRPNLQDEADNFVFELAVAAIPSTIVTQDKAVLQGGELKFLDGVATVRPEEILHEQGLWRDGRRAG